MRLEYVFMYIPSSSWLSDPDAMVPQPYVPYNNNILYYYNDATNIYGHACKLVGSWYILCIQV